MSNWREKGYVPDSDVEEDEELLFTPEDDLSRGRTVEEQSEKTNHIIGGHEDVLLSSNNANVSGTWKDAIPTKPEEGAGLLDASITFGAVTAAPILDLSNAEDEGEDDERSNELLSGCRLTVDGKPTVQEEEDKQTSVPSNPPERDSTPIPRTSNATTHNINRLSSCESSPLSEPPSDLLTPSPPRRVISSSFSVVIPARRVDPQAILPIYIPEDTGPVRNLRHRKPIQVNPYLIERATYRRTMQSRGLQPLNIVAEVQDDAPKGSQEDDYVAAESQEKDDSFPQWRERSTHSENLHPEQLAPSPDAEVAVTPNDNSDYDEDFPDVNTLLHNAVRAGGPAVAKGVKRRKLAHNYSHNSLIQPVGRNADSNRKIQSSNAVASANVKDIYSLPVSESPSPVRASQSRIIRNSQANRRSRSTSLSAAIPESASEGNQHESDDDSYTISSAIQRPRAISISSETSEAETIDIRRLQKKTIGVLPASWWKLDMRNRANRDKTKHHQARKSISPPRTLNRPGVARVKISSRPRNLTEDSFFIADDSDDSDANNSLHLHPLPLARENLDVNNDATPQNWGEFDDEVIIEDDNIDLMLPKSSGKRQTTLSSHTKKRKTNQTTLRQAGFEIFHKHGRVGNHISRNSSQRLTDRLLSRRPRALTSEQIQRGVLLPKISFLDMYQHQKASSNSTPPRFLKVAQRTVRKRKDAGRHEPRDKLFLLHTEGDTRDVQSVLRDWRKGTLSAITCAKTRDVSETTAFNNLQNTVAIEDDASLDKGKHNQKPTRRRLHSTRSLPKQKQTTLNDIVQRTPIVAATRSKGSVTANYRQNFGIANLFPAQVEALSGKFYTGNRAILRRASTPLINILRQQRPRPVRPFAHPSLGKFLEDDDLVVDPLTALKQRTPLVSAMSARHAITSPVPTVTATPLKLPLRRIRRKRTPERIDIEAREIRQPPLEHVLIEESEPHFVIPPIELSVLTGFAPYGTNYSLNFDTHPLKAGTRFNAETFIGGGYLHKALRRPLAQEDRPRNRTVTFTFARQELHWGVYEESIAVQIESIMEIIMDRSEKAFETASREDVDAYLFAASAYSFYKFLSMYISEIVYFLDSVDLVSFAQRIFRVLSEFLFRISAAFAGVQGNPNPQLASTKIGIQAYTFGILLALQILSLCEHQEEVKSRFESEKLLLKFAKGLVAKLCRMGSEIIRNCFEEQIQRARFEKGIGTEHYTIESWVVMLHVANHINSSDLSIWSLLNPELHEDEIVKVSDIRIFERTWKYLFSLLPLFQFDIHGVVGQSSREHHITENWDLLKKLASGFLAKYPSNTDKVTINDYCRMIYARSHHLITKWGWTNPEGIVAVLFGFFASNNLANLKHEFDNGSPQFLQNLETPPTLEVEASDRCFHILLKVIAVGLLSMRTTSTIKYIRNYVFRLIPNHRRQYPKEEELQLDHLTALRNHHDLLCTLYWASPPNCRPPLSAIRDLVDPQASHRQACNVSIRAWSYLIRFQSHTDEDPATLATLMGWFDDLMTQTFAQHNSCRSEATKQLLAEKDKGNTDITEEDLEATVRRNQRQLEGLLSEAVRFLRSALAALRGRLTSAKCLLTPASTSMILNSVNKVSYRLVIESLHVVETYLNVCELPPEQKPATGQQATEESQDYGDWTGLEEVLIQGEKKSAGEHLMTVAYEPLHRILSNCFGAEIQPEEQLLVETVETWVKTAKFLVDIGLKSWENYIGSYSHESWSALRDTEQTRKFTAYYMSRLIQNSRAAYWANKVMFLTYWMRTLVDRESMLKYQHEYTNALLNGDSENPLLLNLPFAKNDASGLYKITFYEFRSRRLSLISSVLANMRVSVEGSSFGAPIHESNVLRREYADMLHAMMKSMRENYEDLQSKDGGVSRSGAYVEFVQQVVEYLQQHTIDIVPVDRFFTDSAAFPLPVKDPMYVVGKLKNYGLKLSLPRTHKQLAAFFQTVSERAAVDGQQEYLVEQIITALTGEFENGDGIKPTLRTFFFVAIFPAYVECAFQVSAGWVIALPVLRAIVTVLGTIKEGIDSTDFPAIKLVLLSLSPLVKSLKEAIQAALEKQEAIHKEWILTTFMTAIDVVMNVIPIFDWLATQRGILGVGPDDDGAERRGSSVTNMIRYGIRDVSSILISLNNLERIIFGQAVVEEFDVLDDAEIQEQGNPESEFSPVMLSQQLREADTVRRYTTSSLHSTLSREWVQSSSSSSEQLPQFSVIRGLSRRTISTISLNLYKKTANEYLLLTGADKAATAVPVPINTAENDKDINREYQMWDSCLTMIKECVRIAARTDVWEALVRRIDEQVWREERGPRGGRGGWRGRLGLGYVFC